MFGVFAFIQKPPNMQTHTTNKIKGLQTRLSLMIWDARAKDRHFAGAKHWCNKLQPDYIIMQCHHRCTDRQLHQAAAMMSHHKQKAFYIYKQAK